MGGVVWSRRANDDLVAIHRYISGSSPAAANRLVNQLIGRADQLAIFPNSGSIIPEFGIPLLRELKDHPYRILYEVFPDRVEILTVVHAARQIDHG
jgi:plasmid stabilization system protein ParE